MGRFNGDWRERERVAGEEMDRADENRHVLPPRDYERIAREYELADLKSRRYRGRAGGRPLSEDEYREHKARIKAQYPNIKSGEREMGNPLGSLEGAVNQFGNMAAFGGAPAQQPQVPRPQTAQDTNQLTDPRLGVRRNDALANMPQDFQGTGDWNNWGGGRFAPPQRAQARLQPPQRPGLMERFNTWRQQPGFFSNLRDRFNRWNSNRQFNQFRGQLQNLDFDNPAGQETRPDFMLTGGGRGVPPSRPAPSIRQRVSDWWDRPGIFQDLRNRFQDWRANRRTEQDQQARARAAANKGAWAQFDERPPLEYDAGQIAKPGRNMGFSGGMQMPSDEDIFGGSLPSQSMPKPPNLANMYAQLNSSGEDPFMPQASSRPPAQHQPLGNPPASANPPAFNMQPPAQSPNPMANVYPMPQHPNPIVVPPTNDEYD